MNINKSTWHYKFLVFATEGRVKRNTNETVCSYVRALFLYLWLATAALLGGIIIIFGVLYLMLVPFFGDVSLTHSIIVAIVYSLIAWGGIYIVRDESVEISWNKTIYTFPEKDKSNKEPNLIVEWIKNKHNKFCTSITFKD